MQRIQLKIMLGMPFSQLKLRVYIFDAGLKRKCPAEFQQSKIKTLTVYLSLYIYREIYIIYMHVLKGILRKVPRTQSKKWSKSDVQMVFKCYATPTISVNASGKANQDRPSLQEQLFSISQVSEIATK